MQSNIEVTEEDFFALGDAAQAALNRGDKAAAEALDKLARKALAALSTSRIGGWRAYLKPLRWEEMPTTLSDQAPDNIRPATAPVKAAEDFTLAIELTLRL
jgi:hypothetical protein